MRSIFIARIGDHLTAPGRVYSEIYARVRKDSSPIFAGIKAAAGGTIYNGAAALTSAFVAGVGGTMAWSVLAVPAIVVVPLTAAFATIAHTSACMEIAGAPRTRAHSAGAVAEAADARNLRRVEERPKPDDALLLAHQPFLNPMRW